MFSNPKSHNGISLLRFRIFLLQIIEAFALKKSRVSTIRAVQEIRAASGTKMFERLVFT